MEIMEKLSNALDKFVTKNHGDIQKIKGNIIIKVWHTILAVLEKVWWAIDTIMEAIDCDSKKK